MSASTLEITPKQLAQETAPIDPGLSTYDWRSQTRLFPLGKPVDPAMWSTNQGFDSATGTIRSKVDDVEIVD